MGGSGKAITRWSRNWRCGSLLESWLSIEMLLVEWHITPVEYLPVFRSNPGSNHVFGVNLLCTQYLLKLSACADVYSKVRNEGYNVILYISCISIGSMSDLV